MNKLLLLLLLTTFVLFSCDKNKKQLEMPIVESSSNTNTNVSAELPENTVEYDLTPVVKTDAEWLDILGKTRYHILREAGTERAFTGALLDNNEEGIYVCAGCQLPLFHSDAKFHSGSGWPSYFMPIKEENIKLKTDTSLGMKRVEILCARCGGHLGHVFEDGPQPTGLRYCVNSASLEFSSKP